MQFVAERCSVSLTKKKQKMNCNVISPRDILAQVIYVRKSLDKR